MSNCKLFLLAVATLTVILIVADQAQSSDLCKRPAKLFDNLHTVSEYIECIKSQSNTRYGKRAFSPLLGKIRPDLYTDDYDSWQTYDQLRDN